MSLFHKGDYVEVTCDVTITDEDKNPMEMFPAGTLGFVEHVFDALTEEEEEEIRDDINDVQATEGNVKVNYESDEGIYQDEDGNWWDADWDAEYSVRTATGHLLTVYQQQLKRSRHPLSDKQLPLPVIGETD